MKWPAGFEEWQRAFLSWLDSPDQSIQQLLRWMNGDDLPAEDPYAEPPYWLLRAMMDNRRAQWGSILALRVAKVLDDALQLLPPGKSNDRILANLLALCASLARPDELASALDAFAANNDLSARKNGAMPLNIPLRFALAFNQSDDRFFTKYWCRMIEDPESSSLRGDSLDGLDGVLLMPGKDLHKIGWALAAIARQLESAHSDESAHDTEFRKVLSRVSLRRPDLDDGDLFSAGRQEQWPIWAINLIPVVANVIGAAAAYFDVAREESIRLVWNEVLEKAPAAWCDVPSLKGILFHQLQHDQGYGVNESNSERERMELLTAVCS